MKNMIISALLTVTLILSVIVLASCSEAEPLPDGVSELPDLDASELTASLADETGEIQWPAELLPEGFPVPKYEEIYSVEREDNEVRIVLLSKRKYASEFPDNSFASKLYAQGYVFYVPASTDYNAMPGINRDGWRVQTANSNSAEWLVPFAEKYGYAYEINVRQVVTGVPDSLFWTYPVQNTDLGYENMAFNEWPTDLLPANIPIPSPDSIMSMEARPNGIFITVKSRVNSEKTYEQMLYEAGYYQMALQPHRDKDGNYFYIVSSRGESEDGDYYLITTFQICKYNDKIVK